MLRIARELAGAPGRCLIVLAVVGCVVLLAACGSSSKPDTSASGGSVSSPSVFTVSFAQCMRKHGVSNYPDPGSGSISGAGINPQSPAFQAAQKACFKLFPGSDPGATTANTAATKRQFLADAECMRKHGFSNFPDPTTGVKLGKIFGPGGPGSSGPPRGPGGTTSTQDGVSFVLPASINIQSPAFTHATTACGLSGLFGVSPGTTTG